jgi:Ca2+-binding RTX toxin-like protein
MVRDPEQFNNLAGNPGHRDVLRRLHLRAADEVERLGGRVDFLSERIRGTDDDEAIWVSPNLVEAAGGDGDDSYLAVSPRAIVEREDGGFDTLMLFAAREGQVVRAKIPRSVELTMLDRRAPGVLLGSADDEIVLGSAGPDRIEGRRGSDRLKGGAGDDVLSGGPGADTLRGASGADLFAFRAGTGRDAIRDFTPDDDRVDLGALGLDGLGDVERRTTDQGWARLVVPDADVTIVFVGLSWSDLDRSDFIF